MGLTLVDDVISLQSVEIGDDFAILRVLAPALFVPSVRRPSTTRRRALMMFWALPKLTFYALSSKRLREKETSFPFRHTP